MNSRSNWFATFTFLDASGAISASQLERLLADVTAPWRWARGWLARLGSRRRG